MLMSLHSSGSTPGAQQGTACSSASTAAQGSECAPPDRGDHSAGVMWCSEEGWPGSCPVFVTSTNFSSHPETQGSAGSAAARARTLKAASGENSRVCVRRSRLERSDATSSSTAASRPSTQHTARTNASAGVPSSSCGPQQAAGRTSCTLTLQAGSAVAPANGWQAHHRVCQLRAADVPSSTCQRMGGVLESQHLPPTECCLHAVSDRDGAGFRECT